jgi:hypothetical protein
MAAIMLRRSRFLPNKTTPKQFQNQTKEAKAPPTPKRKLISNTNKSLPDESGHEAKETLTKL